MKRINQLLLAALFGLASLSAARAQSQSNLTLNLSNRAPDGTSFDNVVFYSGSQYGDASIYATFGGNGTRYFTVNSPGENKDVEVKQDGFFSIRPMGNYVVDKSKIKNFAGSSNNITGVVDIAARQLVFTAGAVQETSPAPGVEITILYYTGAGTFPVQLIESTSRGPRAGLLVELLNENGSSTGQFLSNPNDMGGNYTGRENFGYSKGDNRFIKATLPANIAPGTYRVRIVTTGLQKNVLGSQSGTFTIKSNASVTTGNVAGDVCQGGTLSVPYSTNGTVGGLIVQLIDANGNAMSGITTSGSSSPLTVQLPGGLSGRYRVRISGTSGGSGTSNEFTIHARPTMALVNTALGIMFDGEVFKGGTAPIGFSVNSDSPWTMKYLDPESGATILFPGSGGTSDKDGFFFPNPVASGSYSSRNVSEFKNQYCDGQVSGSVNINVKPMTIVTGDPDPKVLCGGATIKVPMTTNGVGIFREQGKAGVAFVLQLLDNNNTFLRDLPTGGGFANNRSAGGATFTADVPGDLGNGTYKVRVVFKNGNPEVIGSVGGSFTVSRAVSPSASSPAPVCVGSASVAFQATGSGRVSWFDGSGNGLPGAPVQSAQNAGVYTYYVSQNTNGCESERVKVELTVKPKSTPPGDATREFCQNEPTQQLTTNAQSPIWEGGNGQAPTPATGTPGTQLFKLSQDTNGCRSDQSTVTVVVKPLPTAPGVTTPNALCQFGPSQKLTASGNGLKWYRADGSFIGTDAPTPDLGNTATQTYQVSQTEAGCEGPKETISQTFKAAPEKPVATPLLLCRLKETAPVSATALPGHKLNWYGQSETGGTATPDAPVIGTTTAIRTNYYVSQTQESTTCESLRQAVLVIVADSPGPPSVNASQTVCLNTQPVALTAGGDALFWAASSGGGLTAPDVAPVPPTSAAATFSYTVVQRLGTCVSPASTITFTVRPLPVAPVVKSLQIACINDASFALSATALSGHTLNWYDNDQRRNPQASVTVATGAAATKNWFVTQTDGTGCEGPATPQTSRILAKATARLYGDDEVFFFDSTAIRIQLGGEGPWNLTLWNDKVITNNLTNPLVVWVPPTTVTRTYALKALSNECGTGAPSNNYEIRIINRPVVTANDPALPDVSLTAYPNPVGADVQVSWRAISRSIVLLRVVSLTGSVVWQVERTATGGPQTETIQAGAWAAGIYTLQLQTGTANALESRLLKL